MAYRVAWSWRAVENLEAIAQYISADSTAYAAAVVKTILNTTRNLSPKNKGLQRTRRFIASLVSCVGEPLKRSAGFFSL